MERGGRVEQVTGGAGAAAPAYPAGASVVFLPHFSRAFFPAPNRASGASGLVPSGSEGRREERI